MKKKTYAEASNLLEQYRLAVINHRDAVYSIAYKINGGPSFGKISDEMVKRYEDARIKLLEIERKISDLKFS
mgnify:CR=1 FL=1